MPTLSFGFWNMQHLASGSEESKLRSARHFLTRQTLDGVNGRDITLFCEVLGDNKGDHVNRVRLSATQRLTAHRLVNRTVNRHQLCYAAANSHADMDNALTEIRLMRVEVSPGPSCYVQVPNAGWMLRVPGLPGESTNAFQRICPRSPALLIGDDGRARTFEADGRQFFVVLFHAPANNRSAAKALAALVAGLDAAVDAPGNALPRDWILLGDLNVQPADVSQLLFQMGIYSYNDQQALEPRLVTPNVATKKNVDVRLGKMEGGTPQALDEDEAETAKHLRNLAIIAKSPETLTGTKQSPRKDLKRRDNKAWGMRGDFIEKPKKTHPEIQHILDLKKSNWEKRREYMNENGLVHMPMLARSAYDWCATSRDLIGWVSCTVYSGADDTVWSDVGDHFPIRVKVGNPAGPVLALAGNPQPQPPPVQPISGPLIANVPAPAQPAPFPKSLLNKRGKRVPTGPTDKKRLFVLGPDDAPVLSLLAPQATPGQGPGNAPGGAMIE